MSGIARTHATGGEGMLPELLAWSSSLGLDRQLACEDLLGSAAHVTMLARTGLVPIDDAAALRKELLAMHAAADAGALELPDGEEDVHMAVEALLGARLGASVAGRLHTARSRNDQVALDLRLHVREQARGALLAAVELLDQLVVRAVAERDVLIPAYTHRQRAQPTTVGFLLAAWGVSLSRGAELLSFTLERCARSPLGSGACSGSSLPIDRALTARLLGFAGPTVNALDTVGDRDFALDFSWAAARVLLSLSRLSTDIIDYSTSEFGFVVLDGRIAAGSSMMPQKKNPDMFELVRGESSRAIGNVVSLLTLIKGLPTGYNRDLQEDRRPILDTAPLLLGALRAVSLSLPHVHFDRARTAAALADGSTQATDLAEALVQRKGVPFREAYKAVGALVRHAADYGRTLRSIGLDEALQFHPAFDAVVLASLDPAEAARRKESAGGTGAVEPQLELLRAESARLRAVALSVPTLSSLAARLAEEPLS